MSVPVSVFASPQSPLRALVSYLRNDQGMAYMEIARRLQRSYRAVWGADQKITIRPARAQHSIPLSSFNGTLSVLETVVTHLKDHQGLRFSIIAGLLAKDPRTVWTAWHRAQQKLTTAHA